MEKILKEITVRVRKLIIEMGKKVETPIHIGPSFSCVDILVALYFGIMNVEPDIPEWEERDRFILSKGHATPALYAVLATRGFFTRELLFDFRKIGCSLEGHPVMNRMIGIDMTSGSLGNGLSIGMGMAYYLKHNKINRNVYVLLGDGECQEGNIWEAALTSAALSLDNLIAIVDNNQFQSTGATKDIVNMEPLTSKWAAMGWIVEEIDGHNIGQIIDTLKKVMHGYGKPKVLIAKTVKGKGVSFMENNNEWHQKKINEDEYIKAMKECEEKRYE